MSLIREQRQIEFDKLWKRWPNKDSRKQSELNFNKSVKTYQDIADINQALTNYLNMLKRETWRKCKSGSTWFNNWTDWVGYVSPELIPRAVCKPLTLEQRKEVEYSFSDECQDNIKAKLFKAWRNAKSRRILDGAPVCMW